MPELTDFKPRWLQKNACTCDLFAVLHEWLCQYIAVVMAHYEAL
jgi:hypothetical protein